MNNKIIFISGVSGSGKTTLISNLITQIPMIHYVPSYVTRPMRQGEKNGERYFFVTKKKFEESIEKGEFLEYTLERDEFYYGTKKSSLLEPLFQGFIPIKEIDVLGLEKLKKDKLLKNKIISIFLNIPNKKIIERIKLRGELPPAEVQKRLDRAKMEREKAPQIYDYILNNVEGIPNLVDKTYKILQKELEISQL